MEEASSIPVADPANPGKSRRKRQFSVLIACVLIATLLWFLRAFENEYTTRIIHPVKYTNLPENMIPISLLPQKITIEVKGLGFSVLRHNWNFSKTPLNIDVKNLKTAQSKRRKGFVEYMALDQHLSEFTNQLKDLKVIAVFPDSLEFRFAPKKSRKVRIIPVIIYEPGASAVPDSLISTNPDSTELQGPDFILDTIQSIRTLPVRVNKQGNAVRQDFGLEQVHRLVKIKTLKVTVTIGKNT